MQLCGTVGESSISMELYFTYCCLATASKHLSSGKPCDVAIVHGGFVVPICEHSVSLLPRVCGTSPRQWILHRKSLYMLYAVRRALCVSPQHKPDRWLWYCEFSPRSKGWRAWATAKSLHNSRHVLWYTRPSDAFALAEAASLLKSAVPETNVLHRRRFNVEREAKRCAVMANRGLMM
jgi:hypothetical protein